MNLNPKRCIILVSTLLVCISVFCSFSLSVRAEDEVLQGSFEDRVFWEYCDGTLVIRGTGALPQGFLNANQYGGIVRRNTKRVVIEGDISSIQGHAFYWGNGNSFEFTSIEQITILSEKIVEIDRAAFYCIPTLKEVSLPDGLRVIGHNAFAYCTALSTVNIPDSVTCIESNAFKGCTELTSLSIPAGVKSIGDGAFENCTGLKSITIPEGVTCIGKSAFLGCTELQSIDLPNSLLTVGESAFQSCSNLFAIDLSKNISEISNNAFRASGLKSIEIPEKCASIGEEAFRGCLSLEEVRIQSGVAIIKKNCFWNCSSLKTIWIPDSVSIIEERAFAGCSSLETVRIPTKLERLMEQTFSGCNSLKELIIPNSVKMIHSYAFGMLETVIIGTDPNRAFCGFAYSLGGEVVCYEWKSICTDSQERYVFPIYTPFFGSVEEMECINPMCDHGHIEEYVSCTNHCKDGWICSDICSVCDGKGSYGSTFNCGSCGGTGWITETTYKYCPYCYDAPTGNFNLNSDCSYCRGVGVKFYDRKKTCPECDGKGNTFEKCSSCQGTGYLTRIKCSVCNGDGKMWTVRNCPACNGTGRRSINSYILNSVFVPGDLDENGEIDINDAIYLLYYTFFPDDYLMNQQVDFDGNRVIDINDAVYILYYTFFPEDYPLINKNEIIVPDDLGDQESGSNNPDPSTGDENGATGEETASMPFFGAIVSFGPYEWVVLRTDGNNALLLSKYGLARMPYSYFTERGSISWADSLPRVWLNGEFLNGFSADERSRIVPVETESGVMDLAFLLSMGEVDTAVYYASEPDIESFPPGTPEYSALLSGLSLLQECRYEDENGASCNWWLRQTTTDGDAWYLDYIFEIDRQPSDSTVGYDVAGEPDPSIYGGVVRPAIWVQMVP